MPDTTAYTPSAIIGADLPRAHATGIRIRELPVRIEDLRSSTISA